MNRRDFLKLSVALPAFLTFGKVEAKGMIFHKNDSPEISYFGRWQNGYTGFGATYIKVKFTGNKIGAVLKSPGVWWRVSVDGGELRKFTANGEVTLAENLQQGEHELFLARSTEGQAGIAYFGGFYLESGEKLIKSKRKRRAIEIIGDSISAGAMNDGVLTSTNYNEVGDGLGAFGPVLANLLDAEFSVVAKSGQGVAVNYTERPPFSMPHAADLYDWTFFSNDFNSDNPEWDAKNFPVDATIVAYGTNDFTTPYEKPSEADFKAEYRRLIRKIRAKNGNIPIICIRPSSKGNVPFAANYINDTVKYFQELNDQNIYYIEVNHKRPLLKKTDYVDGAVHPNKIGSKKIAEFLLPKVKSIMKW